MRLRPRRPSPRVRQAGFPTGQDAAAAPLFHHPTPLLHPSSPSLHLRHTQAHTRGPLAPAASGSAAGTRPTQGQEATDLLPGLFSLRSPASTPPQSPLLRRFFPPRHRCQQPLSCSPCGAAKKFTSREGAAGSCWRICCRRISTFGRGEGPRRCRTRRGPGITACGSHRSRRCRRGPRSPDAPARPAPRPRLAGPAAPGAEEPRAAQGGGQRPARAFAAPEAGARRAPGERASGGGRAGGRGASRRKERRGRNFAARCLKARRRCEAAAAAPAGSGRVSAGGAARGAACAPSE